MKHTSTIFIRRVAKMLLTLLLVANANYAYGAITLSNGKVLKGDISTAVVYIKSGATVKFHDLDLSSLKGVICKGNATIILEGSNELRGTKNGYPGIFVPDGKTLTIQGSGSLNVMGGKQAAGIGSRPGKKCGNIVINGGDIKARGGYYGAGIGSGYKGKCGTITIGSDITCVNGIGGMQAKGVGKGWQGKCGSITLSPGLECSNTGCKSLITPSGHTTTDGTLTSETGVVTLSDGAVLSGTGGENTCVNIAAGATVLFEDVNITKITINESHRWAGITCEGDANIVLTGTNQVKGGYESAGIYVPEGATLTISGSGSLTATGRDGSAGIGSNKDTSCGNIVIEDGTVNAIGGSFGAGIGGLCTANSEGVTGGVEEEVEGSEGSVEGEEDDEEDDDEVFDENDDVETDVFRPNIAIMGGTVTATGGSGAAGIGGSYNKDCSTATIEITGGTVVTQGGIGAAGIGSGSGSNASWGKIGIGGRIISVTATAGEGGSDAIIGGTLLKPTGILDETTGSTRTLSNPKWAGSGTENDPYIISTPQELNLLAYRVNYSEGDYPEKYYKLGANIAYSTASDKMTRDYDQDGVRESNFECIGYYDDDDLYMAFRGHFDGGGYTISGIRLHRTGPGGEGDASDYQGLFSWINNGEVKNLRLRDVQITGHDAVGGIAGCMTAAKVSNCYVGNDVIIDAVADEADSHGGIAGFVAWNGSIEGCVSAATVSNKKTSPDLRYSYFGGIAGDNYGELRNNLVLGTNIHTTADDDSYGAIVGREDKDGKLQHNYYSGCTVGSDNSGGVGYYYDGSTDKSVTDFTDDDGAVPGLRDDASNSYAQSLLAALPANLDLGWGVGKYPLSLAGRTLYKDGNWNTLCLPFDVTLAGSPLDGATARKLTAASIEGTELNLTFSDPVDKLVAGTPYIIKWAAAATNIVSPTFSGVTISSADNSYDNKATDDTRVRFLGKYDPIVWETKNKSILFLGTNNKLYYPQPSGGQNPRINAFRAYFQLGDGTNAPQITAFNLNFDGDDATSIRSLSPDPSPSREGSAGAWYDMQGRKLDAKPTKKGLYINNGKKVVIK